VSEKKTFILTIPCWIDDAETSPELLESRLVTRLTGGMAPGYGWQVRIDAQNELEACTHFAKALVHALQFTQLISNTPQHGPLAWTTVEVPADAPVGTIEDDESETP